MSGVSRWRPSAELRTWYGHDPTRFGEFSRRYHAELEDPTRAAALEHLHKLAAHKTVTLLTASRAVEISQAAVLADMIRRFGIADKGGSR